MNLKKLAENLGIEENEFSELMAIFLEKSSSDLSKMQSAIDEGDTDKAMTTAHSIKGTAATLGLKEICEVAKRMETNAYQNNLDGVAEGVRTIKEKNGCDRSNLYGKGMKRKDQDKGWERDTVGAPLQGISR